MTGEGIVIPIETPGASEAAAVLGQVGAQVDGLGSSITRAAATFNQLHAAFTTVVGSVGALATRIGEASEEQERLNALSARLGVNFDEAAASAGRFADETEAMAAAGRFASADITVTQQRLNDLMRVAGAASITLGTDTAGAVQMLQEALVRGREGGLQRFGTELASVAGQSHTVEERFAALHEQALRVGKAHDTAADSVKRFQDAIGDSARTMSSAFTTELARLAAVRSGFAAASSSAEDFKHTLEAIAQTAALMVHAVVGGLQIIAGVDGAILGGIAEIAGRLPGLGSFRQAGHDFRMESQRLVSGAVSGLEAIGRDQGTSRTTAAPEAAPAAQVGAGDTRRHGGAGHGASGSEGDRIARQQEAALAASMEQARAAAIDADFRAVLRLGTAEDQLAEHREVNFNAYLHEQAANVIARKQEAARAADAVVVAKKERDLLTERATAHARFTGHLTELYAQQESAGTRLADATRSTFSDIGNAMSTHIQAVVAGKETLGHALRGMLSDTLGAIAKEAAAKGALYFAEGLGHLITAPPLAAADFGASAAFFAVAALAGAGAAATAPSSAPAAGGGAASGARAAPVSSTSGSGAQQGGGGNTTIIYNAPQFGGRTGTMSEVGQHVMRYTNVENARTTRAA